MTEAQQRFMAAFKKLGGYPSQADVARMMKVSRSRANVVYHQLLRMGALPPKKRPR